MRYRKPSLKNMLGITSAKKRVKHDLGLYEISKITNAPKNTKRRTKRKIGYESAGAQLFRFIRRLLKYGLGSLPQLSSLIGNSESYRRSSQFPLVHLSIESASNELYWLARWDHSNPTCNYRGNIGTSSRTRLCRALELHLYSGRRLVGSYCGSLRV